jgi:hypothetical protein
LCARFERQREGFAGNCRNNPECFFVLRFDFILDGDCTSRSQFDKIDLRRVCMADLTTTGLGAGDRKTVVNGCRRNAE